LLPSFLITVSEGGGLPGGFLLVLRACCYHVEYFQFEAFGPTYLEGGPTAPRSLSPALHSVFALTIFGVDLVSGSYLYIYVQATLRP